VKRLPEPGGTVENRRAVARGAGVRGGTPSERTDVPAHMAVNVGSRHGTPVRRDDALGGQPSKDGAEGSPKALPRGGRQDDLPDVAEHARIRTATAGLRQAMMVAFGAKLDTLADFGLAPRKARVQTPDQKIAAAAKAKATREARHTLGKVQRSTITGAHPAGASAGAPVDAAAGSEPAPASKA